MQEIRRSWISSWNFLLNPNIKSSQVIGIMFWSSDWNYVLLKRNYYGNYYIHIVFLIIALVLNAWAIVINVIYFGYSLFGKSNVVLITTETLDENGNPLEFDDVEDIQVFYSQETWDKAIELSKLE